MMKDKIPFHRMDDSIGFLTSEVSSDDYVLLLPNKSTRIPRTVHPFFAYGQAKKSRKKNSEYRIHPNFLKNNQNSEDFYRKTSIHRVFLHEPLSAYCRKAKLLEYLFRFPPIQIQYYHSAIWTFKRTVGNFFLFLKWIVIEGLIYYQKGIIPVLLSAVPFFMGVFIAFCCFFFLCYQIYSNRNQHPRLKEKFILDNVIYVSSSRNTPLYIRNLNRKRWNDVNHDLNLIICPASLLISNRFRKAFGCIAHQTNIEIISEDRRRTAIFILTLKKMPKELYFSHQISFSYVIAHVAPVEIVFCFLVVGCMSAYVFGLICLMNE